jgi:pyrophosphatase PpaX
VSREVNGVVRGGERTGIRAVLFDFDGTLADTTELILRCYRHTMTCHLGEVPPDEEWLSGFGTPLRTQITRFARTLEEVEVMLETYRSFQRREFDTVLRPFPGAVETIGELARQGVPMAIVTSRYRESTLRGIDLCGLTDHISIIVTPEDVTHAKPHPEPVLCALDRLGAEAREAVFVGDSPHDIAAGRAAGTWTAAALWGPFPRSVLEAERPDFLLSAQHELLELVGPFPT